jgi:polysaccharide deacetylase family protein (PEP-CTERM system associated)
MLNVLSVDVEDYFHVEAFASRVSPQDWGSFEPRVERNVDRVLELFVRHRVQATFFVLGWVARRFPRLVGNIASAGHEIGCHGFGHQHLEKLTREQFREDIRAARQCLSEQARQPVVAYRAPSFSVTRRSLWALDVLAEEGFEIDSSIFPVRHDLYGIPGAPRFLHWRDRILEFPPSTVRLLGNNIGVGGGGYLRILPYQWTRWAMKRINESEGQPAMVYFHPWEIDPAQPRIRAGLKSRLRHYTNLAFMERRLDRLLQEFRFTTLSEICREFAPDRRAEGAHPSPRDPAPRGLSG